MLSEIKNCQRCSLRHNQAPLYDPTSKCDIMWVGLSAKRVSSPQESPLASNTSTGELIAEIESNLRGLTFHKPNLVKCLPLDKTGKLRYPTKQEMHTCFPYLQAEIEICSPKLVVLLGKRVGEVAGKEFGLEFPGWEEFNYKPITYNGRAFLLVHHPSYISVYKRREWYAFNFGKCEMVSEEKWRKDGA